ncbi:unnamed protein product [Paramecium sonneborni]|uniref:Tetratricopeptide repeat protein n=1 Tax=Paramecium sonneborni TaxID=65129 RepID=A0A8S1JXX1_9CILI|nr:unnamed protein product [Paramecium sonneborni]
MNNSLMLTCRYSLHNNEQISGFCPFPNCTHFRLFCVNCLLEYHCGHAGECKKLNEYSQWAETFKQINHENTTKLDSIQEIITVLKAFKEWYEEQYNTQIDDQTLNIQKFQQKITNLVKIQQITNIIDQSIKPQFEKLKMYLEYIMSQNNITKGLITYDDFIQTLQQPISNLNSRSQKNYEEAKSLYWTGKYKDCIQKCDSYQRFNISDVRFSLLIGDSYLELKEFENAIENYQTALEIDEQNVYAYGKIGDIKQNQGKLEEALSFYEECTKINSELLEFQFKKAKIYQNLKQFQQCLECLNKILSINSSHIEALQMKATILSSKNDKKEEFDEFKQSLKFSGENIKRYIQQQINLRSQFENPSVLGQMLDEDVVNQKFSEAYANLEKNPTKTLQICEGILKLDKSNFQFVILSAYALKQLRRYEEALNLCDMIKKLDPLNLEVGKLQYMIYQLIQ